jgi:hypothetical protein
MASELESQRIALEKPTHCLSRLGGRWRFIALLLASLTATWFLGLSRFLGSRQDRIVPYAHYLADPRFAESLDKCHSDRVRRSLPIADPKRINPRAANHTDFVIRNATVIDGDGLTSSERDIVVSRGTIVHIVPSHPSVLSAYGVNPNRIFDVGGKYVTPGLVGKYNYLLLI